MLKQWIATLKNSTTYELITSLCQLIRAAVMIQVCMRGEGEGGGKERRKGGRGKREEREEKKGGEKEKKRSKTRVLTLQQEDTAENDEVASLTDPHVAVVEEELVQYTTSRSTRRPLHQCH